MQALPSRSHALRLALAAGLALTTISLGACDEKKATQVSVRSSKKVALPKKPELKPREYKKTYDDGAWTVEGLLKHRKDNLDKTVSVRGKLSKVVQCPPPPPPPEPTEEEIKERERINKLRKKRGLEPLEPPKPKRRPRTCNPRPHAFMVDPGSDERYKLLVAGSMWSQLVDFEEGQELTLKGEYVIVSPDGHYLRQAGMLLLEDLPEPEPEPEPDKEEGKE